MISAKKTSEKNWKNNCDNFYMKKIKINNCKRKKKDEHLKIWSRLCGEFFLNDWDSLTLNKRNGGEKFKEIRILL